MFRTLRNAENERRLIIIIYVTLHRITANQGFYLLGLENTTPTFASAIQNFVPAITFLMAVILRIEQVRLNRKDGLAKVAGTIFCVIGATVITLYKGPTIYTPSNHLNSTATLITEVTTTPMVDFGTWFLGDAKGKNWTLGCVYLIGHCLSWSAWLVFQAPILKKYPARLSVTSYTCFFGLLQFLVIALVCERNSQAWLFHSGGEAFTILYAGVVASGIAFAVQIWCIDRGGPVFVAVYQPVQTFVVAIMASIALGEEFYLGGDEKDSSADEDSFLWQSFDYPTDTLLPEMKNGWDKKTGIFRIFTAWKNWDDPSSGDFTVSMRLTNNPETAIWKGSTEFYRSGPLTGGTSSGAYKMKGENHKEAKEQIVKA
ncbi:unnamed protein product [Vicia faba]|uniref:WAT1-related protein n=1 Tax=Vicia faba TaxID=3906 RepID=A0AAV1A747_VICFA|nr:unnamed protein product [Vicia faba]